MFTSSQRHTFVVGLRRCSPSHRERRQSGQENPTILIAAKGLNAVSSRIAGCEHRRIAGSYRQEPNMIVCSLGQRQ